MCPGTEASTPDVCPIKTIQRELQNTCKPRRFSGYTLCTSVSMHLNSDPIRVADSWVGPGLPSQTVPVAAAKVDAPWFRAGEWMSQYFLYIVSDVVSHACVTMRLPNSAMHARKQEMAGARRYTVAVGGTGNTGIELGL